VNNVIVLLQHFILTTSLSPYQYPLSFWKAKLCQTQTGKNRTAHNQKWH